MKMNCGNLAQHYEIDDVTLNRYWNWRNNQINDLAILIKYVKFIGHDFDYCINDTHVLNL